MRDMTDKSAQPTEESGGIMIIQNLRDINLNGGGKSGILTANPKDISAQIENMESNETNILDEDYNAIIVSESKKRQMGLEIDNLDT